MLGEQITGSVTVFGGKDKEDKVNAVVPFPDRRGKTLVSCMSCCFKQEDSLSHEGQLLIVTVMKPVSHVSEIEL